MKKITLLLVAVLVFSCGKETAEKPKHLLSEDEMVNIIYDINMVQSIRSVKSQLLTDNDIVAKQYIYKKYKIDSLDLAQNNAWYAADMENYEKLHKKASERLQSEMDALKPKKDTAQLSKQLKPGSVKTSLQARRDSLRKVASEKEKAAQK
ncbi:MAG: hypothetical protein DI539_16010 [Flavobacterium psychrophilum]|nr:MAG: hypothetical protein DI539_16010 [Flavobacterium psychrophilum]